MMHSQAENDIMIKELKDEVKSEIAIMNGKFVGLDDKVNYKIENAEKCIKIGINDEFKEIINDEAVDKKLESLTKNIKDFQTKNEKLEAEIISVRHGVDNWRAGVNNMKGQDEVSKGVENDLDNIKFEQGAKQRDISRQFEMEWGIG